MKQTAVQWLLCELQTRLLTIKSEPDGIVRETMINDFLIDTDQALEMERQQIIDAWNDGMKSDNGHFGTPEQYYTQTFTEPKND
jgi:predicted secreted protein